MAISMLKIRRPLGRLIFNMGIAIPDKTVFLIETTPCFCFLFGGLYVVVGVVFRVSYQSLVFVVVWILHFHYSKSEFWIVFE